jgi:hypothetical protein
MIVSPKVTSHFLMNDDHFFLSENSGVSED